MPTVTITGKLRNAIRNLPYTAGTVDVAVLDAFGVGVIGYTPEATPFKSVEAGINGADGFTVEIDDDEPSDLRVTFPDTSTATVSVDSGDATQTLEDLLSAGGTAAAGGEITVQGVINRPFSDAAWLGMRVEIALMERFTTTDGVYLPVALPFRMTENGLNDDGVTLYVPTGEPSTWRFRFYESFADDAALLVEASAYLESSMTTVEVADILDGAYGVAYVTLGDELGNTLTDEVGNTLIGSF